MGHPAWNKGLRGESYLKHFEDKSNLFKKAGDYTAILSCKNCGRDFKQTNKIHYFCSISCQTRFWIKNNKSRYAESSALWRKNNKDKEKKRHAEWDRLNAEKKKAGIISRFIKIPQGQICVICETKPAIQKHHEDYSKPLEVAFCCNHCHYELNIQRRLKCQE